MNRPPSLLPAPVAALATGLLVVLAVLCGPSASAIPDADATVAAATIATPATTPATAASSAAGAPETADLPLTVTIETLSPSYVPVSGPIQVTGTVTNTDDEAWQRVNVYSVMGTAPLTTPAELAEAAASPDDTYVGERNTTTGQYDTIDVLEPGESQQFSLRIPRSALGVSAPGVYWFGVHALGENNDGRDEFTDGRARTFLPLVAPGATPVRTALVLPLRREVTYADDGSLAGVDSWSRSLGTDGRLRALVDFGAAAGDRPVTWLVDPALPDAVRQIAAGNPARSIEPTLTTDGQEPTDAPSTDATPSPDPDTEGSTNGSDTSGDAGSDGGLDPDAVAASENAATWLDRLREALGSQEILALPYGDLDVAAAADHDPELLATAVSRTGDALQPFGLPVAPVVGSPSGFIDAAGVRATDPATTILVTDDVFGKEFPDGAPAVAEAEGHRLVVTSSEAADGGPGPGDPYGVIALRQRILSEAALRTLVPGGDPTQPLVVMLPQDWMPSAPSTFFAGLDVDWVALSSVSDAGGATPATPVSLDDLVYPRLQVDRELDAANFSSADDLITAGDALQNLLTRNDVVASAVRDEALNSLSYAARLHADSARASVDRSADSIASVMGGVTISAPPGVNLSSASGRFAVTLTNQLDQPVTVKIAPKSDRDLRISPDDAIEIEPGGRTQVLLTARTSENGVHNVTLALTTSGGAPIGASTELPIRSAQVSNVIWLFLGGGAALLFGAIVVRLVRRVRAAARLSRTADRHVADPA